MRTTRHVYAGLLGPDVVSTLPVKQKLENLMVVPKDIVQPGWNITATTVSRQQFGFNYWDQQVISGKVQRLSSKKNNSLFRKTAEYDSEEDKTNEFGNESAGQQAKVVLQKTEMDDATQSK